MKQLRAKKGDILIKINDGDCEVAWLVPRDRVLAADKKFARKMATNFARHLDKQRTARKQWIADHGLAVPGR